jgi:ABC-type multidrug transport system ATPase subunit
VWRKLQINITSFLKNNQGHPINHLTMLTIENLWFRYPNPQVEILANWSGEIMPGITLVQGCDGRGKSTLLRLLAGVLPANEGQLRLNGVSLKEEPDAYRQQLFWMEPRADTFDQLTPQQYFETVSRRCPGFDAGLIAPLVEGLGLEPHMCKQLFMLSTGSKRKVWLAAAFASGVPLLLLDEPFAALDAPSIAFVKEQLQGISAHAGRAAVIADYEAPSGVTLAGVIDLGD